MGLDSPEHQVMWTKDYILNSPVPEALKILYLPRQQILENKENKINRIKKDLILNNTKLIFNINDQVYRQKNISNSNECFTLSSYGKNLKKQGIQINENKKTGSITIIRKEDCITVGSNPIPLETTGY